VGHEARVRALAVNSATAGASAGDDATIRFWNPGTGEVTAAGSGHEGPVRALTSVAGCFVSGGDDGTIRRWEPVTGAQLAERWPPSRYPVSRRC
jgi:WD40 repeat protein